MPWYQKLQKQRQKFLEQKGVINKSQYDTVKENLEKIKKRLKTTIKK